jgi:SAM-dependent methyltransferase
VTHGELISPLVSLLRCVECGSPLRLIDLSPGTYVELGPDGQLACTGCHDIYPVIAGTARMLRADRRADLLADYPDAARALGLRSGKGHTRRSKDVKRRTADSFAYEWKEFGALREEWRKNFTDYIRPHEPTWFADRLVLDVGAGSGRHSFLAAELGARVVAVDLGGSIDVARRNLPRDVLTVQADAEHLPFERDQFDMVMSIGVLHHLPDPAHAFQAIVPFAGPGGYVHIYVYWVPPRRWHQQVLRGVDVVRRVTTRMPYRLLHALSYPLAAALYATCVVPHRLARRWGPLARLSEALPLKAYTDYPLGVLVNDQFDRFSAPLEHRYRADEIVGWLRDAGLEEARVLANNGWIGSGRRPLAVQSEALALDRPE